MATTTPPSRFLLVQQSVRCGNLLRRVEFKGFTVTVTLSFSKAITVMQCSEVSTSERYHKLYPGCAQISDGLKDISGRGSGNRYVPPALC